MIGSDVTGTDVTGAGVTGIDATGAGGQATEPGEGVTALSRLRELFGRAIDVPPASRDAWLAAEISDPGERAALERLLAADAHSGLLDTSPASLAANLAGSRAAGWLVGRRVGAFRLARLIGEGGMSAVFLAERETGEFRQRVAVKLLRYGLHTDLERRLFQRERRVLAQLDHPNIARLIDGGVSIDGLPYLVMEFIDGLPITRYATAQALPLRERLALFVTVCRAVDAAHRALVVHRDIKPSNILVAADGTVKLLDFGIAKLLADDPDQTSTRIYTPNYAAPEQRDAGAITTATDVYGLGVVLHELITGTRPDPFAPARPSTVAPGGTAAFDRALLRGDLDTIVQKALAIEPAQRYASAGTFADDVSRHLEGRPVEACAPSAWYRLRKFVARHRGAAALSVALVLALVAALGATLWQAALARAQAQRADEMRRFMFAAFTEAAPGAPRDTPPTIVDVVKQAVANARDDRTLGDAVRTELLTQLGGVLRDQGDFAGAQTLLAQNYESARAALGEAAPLTLAAGVQLSQVLAARGDFAQARPLVDALLRAAPRDDMASLARVHQASAHFSYLTNDFAAAVPHIKEARRYAEATGDPVQIDDAISLAAAIANSTGDFAAAIADTRTMLERRIGQYGPEHVSVGVYHSNLAQMLTKTGDVSGAEQEARRAIAIDDAALPKDHPTRAGHLNALTKSLFTQRRYREALETETQALNINRKALPVDHPSTTTNLAVVGKMQLLLENYPAAVTALRESAASCDAKLGPGVLPCPIVRSDYGVALALSGDFAGGDAQARQVITRLEATNPRNPDEEARSWEQLARAQLDTGRPQESLNSIAKIQDRLASIATPSKFWTGRVEVLRGRALLATSRNVEAADALAHAQSALDAGEHPDAMLAAEAPLYRAQAALQAGEVDRAKAYAAQGLEKLAALRSPPSRLVQLGDTLRAR